MKKTLQFILVSVFMAALLLGFYFFYPHVWGEVLYPLNYQDQIKTSSQEFGVDPNLICAFIYTESRFNADSTSGAGARGLMQVMPATAVGIARDLGDTSYSADKLYDPATNIRYGTYYIKGLMNQYNGNLANAAAGYNAGRTRANSWINSGTPLPTETVYFIQKIQKTQKMYDEVYGDWWVEPQVNKPSPFYQGIQNFRNFAGDLIVGNK